MGVCVCDRDSWALRQFWMAVTPKPSHSCYQSVAAHACVYSNCSREHQVWQIAIKIPVATAAHFNFAKPIYMLLCDLERKHHHFFFWGNWEWVIDFALVRPFHTHLCLLVITIGLCWLSYTFSNNAVLSVLAHRRINQKYSLSHW